MFVHVQRKVGLEASSHLLGGWGWKAWEAETPQAAALEAPPGGTIPANPANPKLLTCKNKPL